MKAIPVLLAAALLAVMLASPSGAKVNAKMFCWVPDAEFPVACEEDEDD